ncbi:esterase-like activity of phytase family protein [Actinomadura violacea]|uniref:Esterase-like activity of phytase family protein n=1 Tax=Actinomadura violacea TaxID=2819934 RepID=A0ABS3RK45_9ACTN|nr:esterase-like activity of phytase family protein [Actinomadura violacea]MBO2456948.1 esterase-like activity of phytase family protein [Actinomadura violacea]
MISRTFLAAGIAAATLAAGIAPADAAPRERVRLLGVRTLPTGLTYQGTTVGGLSGIDRDPRTGRYVLISDDRSQIDPSRFYTARIDVSPSGLGPVEVTGTSPFRRPDGSSYPSMKDWQAHPCTSTRAECDAMAPVDPEAVRVDPQERRLWWSQEGDRIITGAGAPVLIDPSIRSARMDGRYDGSLPLPDNEHITAGDKGPRQNRGFEGFTFAASGALVTSILEAPMLQDGPEPSPGKGALARLTVQTRGGRVLGQYAYPVDPLSAPAGANGVSDILAADPSGSGRYLVLERQVGVGEGQKLSTDVRIYEADLRGTTDVASVDSLADAARVRPIRKKLLVDLADTGLGKAGVVEGMTWGPRLRTGERTLILVADDNFGAFGPDLPTQVIALALR